MKGLERNRTCIVGMLIKHSQRAIPESYETFGCTHGIFNEINSCIAVTHYANFIETYLIYFHTF